MYLVGKAAGSGAVLWKSRLLPLFRCAFVTRFSCKSTVCGRDVHNVVGLWLLCVLLLVSSEDMSVCTVCCLFMCACLLPTNYFCSYGLCCGDALFSILVCPRYYLSVLSLHMPLLACDLCNTLSWPLPLLKMGWEGVQVSLERSKSYTQSQ